MPTKTQRPTAAQRSIAAREAATRKTMRLLAIVCAGPVLIVAAYASYFHVVPLAVLNGQSQSLAHVTPVSIDGLLIVAAVAMIADRKARIPQLSLAAGALLTLGANVLSVHPIATPAIAYVLAGTPAVALLLASEMLLRLCLPARTAPRRSRAPRKATQPAATKTKAPARTRAPRTVPVTLWTEPLTDSALR